MAPSSASGKVSEVVESVLDMVEAAQNDHIGHKSAQARELAHQHFQKIVASLGQAGATDMVNAVCIVIAGDQIPSRDSSLDERMLRLVAFFLLLDQGKSNLLNYTSLYVVDCICIHAKNAARIARKAHERNESLSPTQKYIWHLITSPGISPEKMPILVRARPETALLSVSG